MDGPFGYIIGAVLMVAGATVAHEYLRRKPDTISIEELQIENREYRYRLQRLEREVSSLKEQCETLRKSAAHWQDEYDALWYRISKGDDTDGLVG